MYVGGETQVFQPGDEWQPDQCTFCSCILDGKSKFSFYNIPSVPAFYKSANLHLQSVMSETL